MIIKLETIKKIFNHQMISIAAVDDPCIPLKHYCFVKQEKLPNKFLYKKVVNQIKMIIEDGKKDNRRCLVIGEFRVIRDPIRDKRRNGFICQFSCLMV